MFTLRINVADTAPLDGTTALPINASDIVESTGQPQHINRLDLAIGVLFGLYNPGELGLLGLDGSYVMRHCTVFSIGLAQGGFPHLDGSVVQLVAPARPGGGVARRTIIDLAADGVGSGVVTEGVGVPIPVGHQIAFDTTADTLGVAAPGPHLIQMTFGRADLPRRVSAGLLNPPRPAPCVPPDISRYLPDIGLVLTAGTSPATAVNLLGTNFLADDIVTVTRVVPPDGAVLPISGIVIAPSTDIDFDIDAPIAGPTQVGVYQLCVTRASDPSCKTCVTYLRVNA